MRTPFNVRSAANPFINSGTSEVVNKFGRPHTPPQANGEYLEDTPYLAAKAARRTNVKLPSGKTWSEPGIPVSGSTNAVLLHTEHGGTYVELGGNAGAEFVNIIHKSGSRITIASDGSITISGAGDVVMTSDGNSVEAFDGTKEAKYSAGYHIGVSGGKTTINSVGPIEITSGQDITFAAGGKIALNARNAIDVSGSRIAMHATRDTFDLYANGKMSLQTVQRGLNISSTEGINIKSDKALSMVATEEMKVKAEGLTINGGGANVVVAGSSILLNDPNESGSEPDEVTPANVIVLEAPPAQVDVEMPVEFSLGNIEAGDVDDLSES